jgi:hypothetical protein
MVSQQFIRLSTFLREVQTMIYETHTRFIGSLPPHCKLIWDTDVRLQMDPTPPIKKSRTKGKSAASGQATGATGPSSVGTGPAPGVSGSGTWKKKGLFPCDMGLPKKDIHEIQCIEWHLEFAADDDGAQMGLIWTFPGGLVNSAIVHRVSTINNVSMKRI